LPLEKFAEQVLTVRTKDGREVVPLFTEELIAEQCIASLKATDQAPFRFMSERHYLDGLEALQARGYQWISYDPGAVWGKARMFPMAQAVAECRAAIAEREKGGGHEPEMGGSDPTPQ
jgi:hypothetical protein